jgi:hypothetical protein
MNTLTRRYALIRGSLPVFAAWVVCGAATIAATGVAAAQDATAPSAAPAAPAAKLPAKSTAQIDAGEPRAETSPVPKPPAPTAATEAQTAPPAPTQTPAKAAATAPSRPAKAAGAPKTDRLDLTTATVTGDREQPKVMYIVPWKSADMGDLSGKPMNSLLDEALAPVDRDEFRREVAYFGAVKADRSQNGAPSPAAKQVEK